MISIQSLCSEAAMSQPQVLTLGELLIDFVATQSGNLRNSPGFYKCPGGAPANVAVGLRRLGVHTGFIGKVGDDEFGYFLKDVLEKEGIDTKRLHFTKEAKTTLAFVSLAEAGERDFMFYRNPGADELLRPEEIEEDYISSGKVLHFGSLSLTSEPARSATLKAIEYAHEHGLAISFDPNLRPSLWQDEREMKEVTLQFITQCDILKLSEDEVEFISGQGDVESGSWVLFNNSISLIITTLGKKGCFYRTKKGTGRVMGYNVPVKDATGAGDGFTAGFLAYVIKGNFIGKLDSLNGKELSNALDYANAVAAMVVTEFGAMSALPTEEQVRRFIQRGEM